MHQASCLVNVAACLRRENEARSVATLIVDCSTYKGSAAWLGVKAAIGRLKDVSTCLVASGPVSAYFNWHPLPIRGPRLIALAPAGRVGRL